MSFSKLTLDFLSENMLRNDRLWYQQHKDEYKKYVFEPFSEMILKLQPTIEKIDENMLCIPKKMSRIFRDARRLRGKSFFRDTVWYSFNHGEGLYEGAPSYFFEFSPQGFRYGCGYYMAKKESAEALRGMILEGDKSYLEAQKALDDAEGFVLMGDMYKRNHYPDRSEKECNWLNRKDFYLMRYSDDFELLFDMDRLIEQVAEDFLAIAPVYYFLMKAETVAIRLMPS